MIYRLSQHAAAQMERRGIAPDLVDGVLQNPQQIVRQLRGTTVYQSQVDFGGGKLYLLRVFVNELVDPAVVVTVYRTSQITKFWSST